MPDKYREPDLKSWKRAAPTFDLRKFFVCASRSLLPFYVQVHLSSGDGIQAG